MAYLLPRIALYTLLAVFSLILLGLTATRINHTRRLSDFDPLRGGSRGYEPIVAELLATSIIAFLWTLPLMLCLGARTQAGFASSYLTELLGLFILFVMFLVGAAIFTHDYQGSVSRCRGIFTQCRVMTAIEAFSWIAWIITFFLLIAALSSLRKRRASVRAPLHGYGDGAETGTTGAYGHGRKARSASPLRGGVGGTTANTTTTTTNNTGPGTGAYAAPEMRQPGGVV